MRRKTKITLITSLSVILILMGIRIYLPYALTRYLNGVIDNISGYSGQIGDVDLNLWRGAYKVHDLVLDKSSGGIEEPFMKVPLMDVSLHWRALLKGHIEGELLMVDPEITVVVSESEETETLGEEGNWRETLQALLPITINRLECRNGTINILDVPVETASGMAPNLMLTGSNVVVTNLTNARNRAEELPSRLHGTATLAESAEVKADMRFDLMRESMAWDLSLSCRDLYLPNLNDLAVAYANLDFQSGNLEVFSEMALADGNISGYVKLLVKDLKIFELDEEDRNLPGFLWEAVTGLLVQIFENQFRDQFATRIPFEGEVDQAQGNLLLAIASILRNAIIEAMEPGLENTINIDDAKPASKT